MRFRVVQRHMADIGKYGRGAPCRRTDTSDRLGIFQQRTYSGIGPTGEACEATTEFPVTAVDRTVLST